MEPYNEYSTGIWAGIFAAIFVPALIISVINIIGMWKIFEKAGKPGWAAIISIYSTIIMPEIIGKPIWWLFMFLIPCVNIYYGIWAINLLSKSFGQSEGFTIGLIFLSFIFVPLLGFGNYQYIGPAGAGFNQFNPNNPFGNPNDPFNKPNDPFNNPFNNNPPQA